MIEKFSAGDKVYLLHLKEEGVVTRLNGAEMVYVQLSDMEIPVYCTDITRSTPKDIAAAEKLKTEKKAAFSESSAGKDSMLKKDSGLFLSFEPVKNISGEIEQFKVSLVNDTVLSVSFRYRFFLSGNIHFQLDKVVLPYQSFLLHEIVYDALNETPEVDVHVRDVMNEVMKGDLGQKIKPQNFFNKLSSMPLTGKEAYVYSIITTPLQKIVPRKEVKPIVAFDLSLLKEMMMDSTPNKDAELNTAAREIDLHIEKLANDHATMDNTEMLHVQLAKFQQSLDRAIAAGLDRFYVIHGNGTGKLKKEIHRILKSYKEVKSFNNDFHPRYSYGATEIVLH
ncbi:MAG: Smr/MutS family protein [Chitinophagales bacterium]